MKLQEFNNLEARGIFHLVIKLDPKQFEEKSEGFWKKVELMQDVSEISHDRLEIASKKLRMLRARRTEFIQKGQLEPMHHKVWPLRIDLGHNYDLNNLSSLMLTLINIIFNNYKMPITTTVRSDTVEEPSVVESPLTLENLTAKKVIQRLETLLHISNIHNDRSIFEVVRVYLSEVAKIAPFIEELPVNFMAVYKKYRILDPLPTLPVLFGLEINLDDVNLILVALEVGPYDAVAAAVLENVLLKLKMYLKTDLDMFDYYVRIKFLVAVNQKNKDELLKVEALMAKLKYQTRTVLTAQIGKITILRVQEEIKKLNSPIKKRTKEKQPDQNVKKLKKA
jgi:hypothetical protein